MTPTKVVGFNGMSYDSRAEADASFLLAGYNILQDNAYLPLMFHDSNGEPFRAKADFRHALTGVYFELKTKLNGVGTCATSRSQLRSSRCSSEHWKSMDFGWNHSAKKLKTVQESMAQAGQLLVAVFPQGPDISTTKLLSKHHIFWVTLGSSGWSRLINFLKLAQHGLHANLTYTDDMGVPVCSIACSGR